MPIDTPRLADTPQNAAQRTARILLLEALIIRATSGHAPGGSAKARHDRTRMFWELGPEHVQQWQLLRGVTALGVPEPIWMLPVISVLHDLCREGGVPCIADISSVEPGTVREETVGQDMGHQRPELLTERRAADLKAARQLAPATDLRRPIATPILIVRQITLADPGSPDAPEAIGGSLEKIMALREIGYRVILLCRDALPLRRRLGPVVDHTLQLRRPGPWSLSRLCNETDKRLIVSGRNLAAVTPDKLNRIWHPTMSTAVLSMLLDDLATGRDSKAQRLELDGPSLRRSSDTPKPIDEAPPA